MAAAVCSVGLAEGPVSYVAGSIGGYVSGVSGFEQLSSSRSMLSLGAECGFPLSQDVGLYLRFAFVSKSGISVSSLKYYDMGQRLSSPQTVVGDINIWQLKSNYGLSHSFMLMPGTGIEINGGLAFVMFKTGFDLKPGATAPSSPVDDHKALGPFAGFVVVQSLGASRWSLYVEGQYDHFWSITSRISNYGAVELCGGIRFRLDAGK